MPTARYDDVAVAQTAEEQQIARDRSSLAEKTPMIAPGRPPEFEANIEDSAEPDARFFGRNIPILVVLSIASWVLIVFVARAFY